jgi:hypothetical protein
LGQYLTSIREVNNGFNRERPQSETFREVNLPRIPETKALAGLLPGIG